MRKYIFTDGQAFFMKKEKFWASKKRSFPQVMANTYSFYKLKANYDGLELSAARRLLLRNKNSKLKRRLVDNILGYTILKDAM